VSTLAPAHIQPPIKWVTMASPTGRAPECKPNHSSPSSAEVTNECNYTRPQPPKARNENVTATNIRHWTAILPLKKIRVLNILFTENGPGSSVGIATELRAGRSRIESRWGRDFPLVQTGPGAHPVSCKMGTGSFPGVKCGRGVGLTPNPPPPSSADGPRKEYSYISITLRACVAY